MPNYRSRRFLNAAGLVCALLGILIAAMMVDSNYRDRRALAEQLYEQNEFKMRATMEHFRDHMRSIYLGLRLVGLDANIATMSPGPFKHLQALHEATYALHGLTEIYVVKRDFTGQQHPFLGLFREDDGTLIEAHHILELELEEYAVHVEQIRRFVEDPSLHFLVSKPIQLCVGEPGVVCSIPVTSAGYFAGIVAGMVKSDEIANILEVSGTGDELLLAKDDVGIFANSDMSDETLAWFQKRFDSESVRGFFENAGADFRVGNQKAIWSQVQIPGDERWYLAYVYDEARLLHRSAVQSSWAAWGGAGTVTLLGLLTMFLCRLVPALAATRAQAQMRADELAESEVCTRAILETAADGIITIDENGVIESFNAAAERIFGYLSADVIGKRVNMLMPPPHSDRHDEYLQRYLDGGERRLNGQGKELEGLRSNGTVFPLELDVSEVRLPGRRLFTGLVRDISSRKDSEEALRESQDRYRTLVQNIDLGVTLMDSAYGILMVNEAQGKMFNKPCHEFVGKKCYMEFEKRDQRCAECPGTIAMATGRPAEAEREGVRDDGNRFLARIRAFPIIGGDGNTEGFIEVVEDITERRHSEDQARERQAELAHLARLGTLGEMTAGLAHELNQPLCAIVNYMEACTKRIRKGKVAPSELIDDLQDAADQAIRAGDIIEHLRDFARNPGSHRSTVNLNQLVQEVVDLMRHDLKQGCIETHLELCDGLPSLDADAIQIEQVLVNLLKNGIDAMVGNGQEGRCVTIATSLQVEKQMIECTVSDTGPGLDEQAAKQVFKAFYTTKSNGMGVGLAIGRRIIESHGGRLWGEANGDRGAVFRFTLPTRARRTEV